MRTGDPLTDRAGPVVVLAPRGRDAAVVCRTLGDHGIGCAMATGIDDLAARLNGDAGAVLLTEESLTPAGMAGVTAALAGQPSWSDLPVLLLLAASEGSTVPMPGPAAELCAVGNVTVLVRPVTGVALVTAVRAALRARRRQHQVRDLINRERAARLEAERANALKDEFLATVSHELRTPLSAILLWAGLLARGHFDAEQTREAVHAVRESAQAQSRLIEDLLDASRMASGQLRLTLEDADLAEVARVAVAVVRPAADARGVRLDGAIHPGVGRASVDPGRVQQVIWNLLNNAVKFTPAGGVVSLDLRRDGGEALIRVADTGRGIGPELLPHVFERFRQAEGATTRRHAGLGLGLAITRQLVELHGGSVAVASDGPGRGATFTVRLPLHVGSN